MSDEEAFRREFQDIGEELLWDLEDRPKGEGKVELIGVVWWERTNTPDHGEDFDSGFNIESQTIIQPQKGELVGNGPIKGKHGAALVLIGKTRKERLDNLKGVLEEWGVHPGQEWPNPKTGAHLLVLQCGFCNGSYIYDRLEDVPTLDIPCACGKTWLIACFDEEPWK